jgi:hypothetical protein
MNAKTERDTAGKALYLELRKDNYTYQIVLTPPAIDVAGEPVPMCMMERRISSWHPRRNWNFSSVPTNGDFALARTAVGSYEQIDVLAAQHTGANHVHRVLSRTLDSLFHKGWTLFKQPVAVETTYRDLDLIKSGKTSNDLVRRIERSRKAFGFPEALFDEPVTAPVA